MSSSTKRGGPKRAFIFWLGLGSVTLILFLSIFSYSYWSSGLVKVFQGVKVAFAAKGDLAGTVVENYLENPSAKNITIAVDDNKVKVSKTGTFTVSNLATGKHIISIKGEMYENYHKEIEIKEGRNKFVFKTTLTPREAIKRWMKVKQDNRHALTLLLLHPDDKKKIDRTRFIAYKTMIQEKYNPRILNYKIGTPKLIKSWKHPDNKKIYKNVVKTSMNGSIAAVDSGKTIEIKKSWNIFMQKFNGEWLFFTAN